MSYATFKKYLKNEEFDKAFIDLAKMVDKRSKNVLLADREFHDAVIKKDMKTYRMIMAQVEKRIYEVYGDKINDLFEKYNAIWKKG
jgi:hypothetical protein